MLHQIHFLINTFISVFNIHNMGQRMRTDKNINENGMSPTIKTTHCAHVRKDDTGEIRKCGKEK